MKDSHAAVVLTAAFAASFVPPVLAQAVVGKSSGPLALEQRSRQPALPVPPTKRPPAIDGKVEYEEWGDASIQRAFIDQRAGVQSDLRTALHVKYDEEALYVGVVIERPRFAQTPKADFEKGKHKHIWWKDDNFEIFLIPGERETEARYSYVFVGNSKGAFAETLKPLGSTPPVEWEGKWEYAARQTIRGGREDHWPCWEAELRIPYDQFAECRTPAPGVTWELAFMNQQLTPVRRMITWSQAWSFKSDGYASRTMGRLVFTDGFGIRQKRVGRIAGDADGEAVAGNEFILLNAVGTAKKLTIDSALYRADERRTDSKETFLTLWDMVGTIDRTGEKMLQDPKMAVQAFRSREDIVGELNTRYRPTHAADSMATVPARERSYSFYKHPMQHGEYVLMTDMRDAETGRLLYSYALPFAYFPGFNLHVYPHYLRHRKLRVELDLSSFGELTQDDVLEATLIDDAGRALDTSRRTGLDRYGKTSLYLDTSRLPEKTRATVKATLLSPDGRRQHEETRELSRPVNPEWFGNSIGRSEVVCAPFEPLRRTDDRTVELYRRKVRLGPVGLPESILSRGTELLAGPVRLELKTEPDNGPDRFGLSLETFSAHRAEWTSSWAGNVLHVDVRTTLEYDGMLRYNVSLTPASTPLTIERFVLHIPMAREFSRYFGHHATGTRLTSNSTACKGGLLKRWFDEYGEAMPFTFAFMLCAEDRGLQWFCPSDRDWSNHDENAKIAIASDPTANTLVIAIVDIPKQLTQRTQYSFGLIATPVRPCSPDDPTELISGAGLDALAGDGKGKDRDVALRMLDTNRDEGQLGVGDYLNSALFGVPRFYDRTQEQVYAKAIAAIHDRGLKFVPYASWGVNNSLPFFETFGYEMLREPFRDISWNCFLHIMASTFPDWYLHTVKHSRDALGIDGNYMDGTQYPRLAFNELEDMTWTDEQGRLHGTYDVWAQREFAKRLYTFWHHETTPPGLIGTHTSQIPLYFLAGFTDYCASGEYHLQGKTLEDVCPTDTFLMFYCTWPHGVTTHRHWWNWYKKPIMRNEMWTMNMLHDVLMRTGGGNLHWYRDVVGYGREAKPYVRIRRVRREFNQATFVPYWNQRIVSFTPPGPEASLWLHEARKAALIFVANIPNREYRGSMSIRADALPAGIDPQAYDAMLDEEIGDAKQAIELSVKPMRHRMFTIGMRLPLPAHTRIRNEDGTNQPSYANTTKPTPEPLATYTVPQEPVEQDEHTLLLGHFDRTVDLHGTSGTLSGSMKGTPVFSEGKFGNAFRSELDGREIVTYELGDLGPGEAGTLELWFRYLNPAPPEKPVRFPKLLAWKRTSTEALFLHFYRTEEYEPYMVQPYFFLKDDPDKNAHVSLSKQHLDFDAWNHIGITWQGQTVRIFANGRIVRRLELPCPVGRYVGPLLTLGSSYSGGSAVGCLIDEFRLSDVARY